MDKVKLQVSLGGMEQTRRDLLSKSIRAAACEIESMDVTLVCKDGLKMQTHASLMAALSKRMGELFTTLTTFPVVVFIPDLTKEVVEKLLNLYSSEWEEAEVNFDLKQAADLLGLSFPLASQCKEVNTTQHKATHKSSSESKASKPTMPSILVRVKREKRDGVVPDENSDSENSDFESEKYIESAIQGKTRVEKNPHVSNLASLECDQCGTGFEEQEGLKIHIGEVHMEQQLLTELFLTFPGGAHSLTCVGCGEECGSDYEKREHIILSHAWPSLKAQVDEITATFAENRAGNETNHEDLRTELAAHIEMMASIQEKEARVDETYVECEVCGTTFEESEEARIHIGEVHMEEELMSELLKFFPDRAIKCKECGEECGSQYEKKEHILVQHPWPLLKAMADAKEMDTLRKEDFEADGKEQEQEETKQSKILEMKKEKWFQHSTNYSCNYCDNKFSEPSESKRHIEKAHNLIQNPSDHITHAGKKYSCKICRSRVDHNRSAIRSHMRKIHDLDFNAYEAKYEKPSEIQPDDLLEEVLDDTLKELCDPAKRVVSLLKQNKKRKSTRRFQQNSKSMKRLDENVEIESQIEFSDSSDDEE